jgi:hypothetical protein
MGRFWLINLLEIGKFRCELSMAFLKDFIGRFVGINAGVLITAQGENN